MATKSSTDNTTSATAAEPMRSISQLQEAGMGSFMGMGTAWIEAISDLSAEVASFVAERVKEDVKTQHEILHCRNVADLQHIQAQFIQRAMDQYQAETGQLLEMSTKAFVPKTQDT